jgi:hypothetical protein
VVYFFACDLPRAVVLFYKIIRNRPNSDFLAIQGPLATTRDTAGIVLYTVAVAAAVASFRSVRVEQNIPPSNPNPNPKDKDKDKDNDKIIIINVVIVSVKDVGLRDLGIRGLGVGEGGG